MTLREVVQERDRVFQETGYAYGLERLELIERDPAKFMRFQMRLVASCINARETAKLISANPASMLQGELLFLLANPAGDCVAASYGLAGHIQSFPFMIRSIADLGFEDDPGIRKGDIFATNDALYGAPHNADNYTWIPVFHDGELIAWTVGLNHISDVGGIQPGALGVISTSVFTDGFTYPPMKTGENFKQHKWWELHWKRRTRAEAFNILDDKMRVAGAVVLHDRIQEIVKEFGVEYFSKGMKEIIERERRVLIQRIKSEAVPGKYRYLHLNMVRYEGVVGKLFSNSNRNWLLHETGELEVLSDGRISVDLEGLTSEGDFHCNAYESALRNLTSLGAWPMFAYTATLNTALMYITEWNLPAGCMFNPQNPFAATVMGLAEAGKYGFMFHNCLSYAYFARGFLEECYPQHPSGVGYGLAGVMSDGFRWAGGDMRLITCWSCAALPYKDGDPASYCAPNPAPDQGETELAEFLQPTNLGIGTKLIPDYCGHGKFRSGLGIGMCQLIVDPGQSLTVAVFGSTGGMGRNGTGMCGGYPGANDVILFVHGTNFREIIDRGLPYPTDFVELRNWLREGKLRADSIEAYQGPTPNIRCGDGDLFASASGAMGGWGDPLEREFSLLEDDVRYGWLTPDVVRNVYGVAVDDEGKVNVEESEELRQKLRFRRKEMSVVARDWWSGEREQILRKEFAEDVSNMYADILTYGKFRHEFMGIWQLPDNYHL